MSETNFCKCFTSLFYLLLCTLILLLLLRALLLVVARQSGVSLESCHLAPRDSGQAVKITQEKIKVFSINWFQTATAMLSSTCVLQNGYLPHSTDWNSAQLVGRDTKKSVEKKNFEEENNIMHVTYNDLLKLFTSVCKAVSPLRNHRGGQEH